MPRARRALRAPMSAAFLMVALLPTSLTLASEDFPPALQEAAGMDCTPSCLTCHTTEPGTSGTATQPFALAMVDAGLKAGDASTVGPAYEAVFIQEQDPALPEDERLDLDFPCAAEVLYGCGAELAPNSPQKNWAWSLLLGALALPFVRRRSLSRKGA